MKLNKKINRMRVKLFSMVLAAGFAFTGCSNADSLYQQGVSEYKAGNYEEALSKFEAAHKEKPDYALYIFNMAYANIGLSDYAKAEETAASLIRESDVEMIRENNSKAYYIMAVSEFAQGKYKETLKNIDNIEEELFSGSMPEEQAKGCKGAMERMILISKLNTAPNDSELERLCNEYLASEDAVLGAREYFARKFFDKGKYESAVRIAFSGRDPEDITGAYFAYVAYKEAGNSDEAKRMEQLLLSLNAANEYEKSVKQYVSFNSENGNEKIEGIPFVNYTQLDSVQTKLDEINENEAKGDFEQALESINSYLELYPEDEMMVKEQELIRNIISNQNYY